MAKHGGKIAGVKNAVMAMVSEKQRRNSMKAVSQAA
jgi:hypothetical protein